VNIRGYINKRIFGDHPANCSSWENHRTFAYTDSHSMFSTGNLIRWFCTFQFPSHFPQLGQFSNYWGSLAYLSNRISHWEGKVTEWSELCGYQVKLVDYHYHVCYCERNIWKLIFKVITFMSCLTENIHRPGIRVADIILKIFLTFIFM
jgi:hypothetical protein